MLAVPGRGEFIRLAFLAAGTPFSDPANDDPPNDSGANGYGLVQAAMDGKSTGDDAGNPPAFAPPMLKVKDGKGSTGDLVIHQTPNILLYLGNKLGLAGGDESDLYYVNQLALTALDVNNEAHDTHHPVAVGKYYEDQKEESITKATDFREARLPKFFSYFERTLKGNKEGSYLVGSKITYADTTLWQILDGLKFAFPKEMAVRMEEYPQLEEFHTNLKKEKWLNDWLESGKRKPYSIGVYRHYPELDRQ